VKSGASKSRTGRAGDAGYHSRHRAWPTYFGLFHCTVRHPQPRRPNRLSRRDECRAPSGTLLDLHTSRACADAGITLAELEEMLGDHAMTAILAR
jgi:hypothetical protein